MNKRLAIVLCLSASAAANSISIAAGIPPTMTALKSSYESNLQAIARSDVTEDCLAAYGKKLDSMAETLRQSGDLDGVIAVRAEKTRLGMEKNVPAEPAPDAIPAIAKARAEFHQAIAKAEVDKNKRVVALADDYSTSLESLKKQLTQQNKIDEATEVKKEIDRVRSSPEVTSAQFVIADLASKMSRTESLPKDSTTATPSSMAASAPGSSDVRAAGSSKYQRKIECDGDGDCGWTRTTQSVKKGDTVTITAKGSWKCTGLNQTCGPEGYPGSGVGVSAKSHSVVVRGYRYGGGRSSHSEKIYYGQNRHLQDEPYGALLCKIGDTGESRVVGDSLTFTSEEDGWLYLDSNVAPGRSVRSGCSGSMTVTIEVAKKPLP